MMKRTLLSIALLFVSALPILGQVTAIRAGRIYDPETGEMKSSQVILVEKGKISAIGTNVAVPSGAEVIDLSKSVVMPGLFDMHTHLCMDVRSGRDAGRYFYTTLNDPDSARAIQGVVNAKTMLEAGFTSVRDIGNEGNYACTSLRWAIQSGMVPGPTIVNAGRIIAPYGGQFHLQPDKQNLAEPEYFFADTRDEMVKAIRENIHYGARVIKIVVDDQAYIYSVEDIKFMIDEAARAGLKLAAHCWTQKGAENAAAAGVASIEHGFVMDDPTLELAKRNNVVLVGTDYLGLRTSPQGRARWVDRLKRAHQVGVTMAYGTDAIDQREGYTRGTEAIEGIDIWVEAGIPPKDILKAMTGNAARLMGSEKERGFLQTGMAADLIAVPEDPTMNIQTLKKVSFVMKNGTVIRK
jgi:imidazolonepropionase-like amidohydrolase